MKKNQLLSMAAIMLFLLGIIMIFLGVKAQIIPPALTGIGFIIIGTTFLGLREK